MKITIEQLKDMMREQVGAAVAERWEAARAKGVEAKGRPQAEQPHPSVQRSGSDFGRLLRYMNQAQRSGQSVLDIANEHRDASMVEKAISSGLLAAGGAVIDGGFSEEILEALRPMTVIRGSGVATAPLINGSWTQPYEDTGPTASYVGENQQVATTESTFGQLELTAKKLVALVPVSNDWLNDTSGRGDTFIRNSVVRAMAIREDLAFIRGDGTSATPKGLKRWADDNAATNVIAANTTVTVANVTTDLNKLVLAIEENDVPGMAFCWVFAPRTKAYLMSARDGNSNLVWEPEMAQGTLLGFPFKVSNQIPKNLGAGSDSEVYLFETSTTLLADEETVEVQVLPGAAYYDGSSVQAGASRDQTLVTAKSRHDFGCLYRGKESAYLSTVRWGA